MRLLFVLLNARRECSNLTEQTVLFGFPQGCLMATEV
jgi:predicted esterase